MLDIIRRLPDSVANQIAAGEVVQCPASVVKELVENAADAGATSIEVIIRDAGRSLIQVVDNGKGMSERDSRMAFVPHATSKIEQADDLFSLHTMGFRGEALASICAVAQVEMKTRQADSEVGTKIEINGSKIESQEPAACAKGTNIMVKNLFYNVPARRKFLRKDSVEFTYIAREFERMALVNPDLELTLIHNDTVVHQLMRGSLKQRISDLFGKTVEKQLVPVATETSIVKIEGFVGAPEHARRRNALKYLMVNGRHIRHPYFHKAIMLCYETLISADCEPNYFLNFTVDPSTIDVNIHPTKDKIKFENESAIWQILVAAIREALGRFSAMPGIDINSADTLDLPVEIPAFNPNAQSSHDITVDTSYNPFSSSAPKGRGAGVFGSTPGWQKKVTGDWQALYDGFMSPGEKGNNDVNVPSESGFMESLIDDSDREQPVQDGALSIQVKARFILTPSKSGVMIIDQHRAHVLVLYERYRKSLSADNVGVQQVMFPEVMNLSPQQNITVRSIEESIRRMGFDLSFLGDNAWSVVAVPSVLGDANASEVLMNLISDAESNIEADTDRLIDRMALSMARSAAIRGGRVLTDQEREQLLADLLSLPAPGYTPDGLPVIRMMSDKELEALF
ncbi:MAG: DNA mismatch repair endonuclease MutL [Bacteroides sp.]|nr:DNA mismatch repair endonuclease MutL [Bacteroides sp.]MCM1413943.1 DNA mismatch repair endonuclease MutL [Bacteroides sp.]MCM1471630.1 DNA mismatch repair endonuclease MutL [Bacteroides sp.]